MTREHVHLVGIGGMHMSAIAQLLLADGIKVSGSDLTLSTLTDRLVSMGAVVHQGHDARNIAADTTLVVATAAVKAENVEITEAKGRQIAVIARHEMVARLMQGCIAVAVAGTHGKTTTSAMITVILRDAGLDPTYLLGGDIVDLGSNAGVGRGELIVVEADEYAGAFLAYHPRVAVITNIEADHLDYFGSECAVRRAFAEFAANVQGEGLIVACADSPGAVAILGGSRRIAANVVRYGTHAPADWTVGAIEHRDNTQEFEISGPDGIHGPLRIGLAGEHNVSNALAAYVVARQLGVSDGTIARSLAGFRGARRRFELVGEAKGVRVIDDYAHHPTEIGATIAGARDRFPGRRILVLFQPHTYSRTQYLLESFKNCFDAVDALYLLQTFPAREEASAGLDAHDLALSLHQRPEAVFESIDDAAVRLARDLRSGDVCITMGAGDVTKAGPALLRELSR
jgi:UDP-N-acetylmuramate--alanine ligase